MARAVISAAVTTVPVSPLRVAAAELLASTSAGQVAVAATVPTQLAPDTVNPVKVPVPQAVVLTVTTGCTQYAAAAPVPATKVPVPPVVGQVAGVLVLVVCVADAEFEIVPLVPVTCVRRVAEPAPVDPTLVNVNVTVLPSVPSEQDVAPWHDKYACPGCNTSVTVTVLPATAPEKPTVY